MLDLFEYTKELSKLFSKSENILLISHINPDGDSIGSQLALYHYLKAAGKEVRMITPNNIQEFLNWMDGVDKINIFIRNRRICKELIKESDLIVMLDFNQSHRLGEAENYIIKSPAAKVILDHHLEPGNFAELIISDPSMCATSELVYELMLKMENPGIINRLVCEAIYTGIITDTGNFEHGSYTSSTFRIVADLIDRGIDRERILNLVYANFTSDRIRLQGYALNKRLVVLPEYNTAYIFLTKGDLAEYNYIKGDTEGFVNLPLTIRGIRFSALLIEKEKFIKLSFRSKGHFPANIFASKYFFGGGHLNASGGEYPENMENTIKYFLKVLRENVWRFEENG